MLSGGCNCGNITLTLHGEPLAIALCHCIGCRKLSGSPFTFNFLVPLSNLAVSGEGSPKAVARDADSGRAVRNYFCPDCGSPLFGGTLSPTGELETLVVRCGVFDDIGVLHENPPTVEIFVGQRLKWIAKVPGSKEYEGMPQ